MHILFDPESVKFVNFIQVGSNATYFQGYPYQRGRGSLPRQRGDGVGGILKSIWRFVYPLLKSEGIDTGTRIVKDVIFGQPIKKAVINEGAEGIKNLVEKARQKYNQRGSGRRRRKRPFIIKSSEATGRLLDKKAVKKRRLDNLGFF